MGAVLLLSRSFCKKRMQKSSSHTGRKRAVSVSHSEGVDVEALYRQWCGGQRDIEEELCCRIDMELAEGMRYCDVIHVSHLLGIARHIPAFDRGRVKEYETLVQRWRAERFSSLLLLIQYARPRPEVITVVAVLNAVRPLLWERTKITEEFLSGAAKTADFHPFCKFAARYVVFSLLDAGISYMIGQLKRVGVEDFTNTVKSKLISHLLTLDLEYFDTHKTHLTEFTEDIDKLRYLVTDRLFQVLHFSTIAFHSATLSIQNRGQGLVTLSCLLAAPSLYILKDVLMWVQESIDSKVGGQVVSRKGAARESDHTVSGMLKRLVVIRCNAAEDFESDRVMAAEVACLSDALQNQTVGEHSLSAIRGTIVPNLFILYLVAVGNRVAQMRLLNVEDIPRTAEVAIEAFDHIHSLYEEVSEFADSDYTVRLTSLLGTHPTIDTGKGLQLSPEEECGTLSIDNVEFTYPGTTRNILRGVSFTLEYGKKIAVVGRSGCGKSTLAALLIRLYDPDAGSIGYSGRNIKALNVRWMRRHIATVQQSVPLPPGTVLNAFTYGLDNVTLDDVIKVSQVVGLHNIVSSLKDGYDTKIGGSGGASFSGGQTQRIAICRALLSRPRILILDEATNMLDPWTERLVLKNLIKYLGGASLVMISHRASTTQACDLVLCLKSGCVEEVGTFSDLLERNGETAKLFSEEASDEQSFTSGLKF